MDGDASAKTFDSGANSAIRNTEGSDSIHESSHQTAPVGEKTHGTGTSMLTRGLRKNFNADGAIGGAVQQTLGKSQTET
ncbi:hypothetical protein BUE80_DR005025 [Diplocarpon rosae]|nr:hypothetical protein BUE80_DR005025 [Diplocarpon rosae]